MEEKICRLCFGKNFRPFGIFGKKGMRLSVAQMIRMHFPDEVNRNDILPKFMCGECWPKLKQFHEFYNAVSEAKQIYVKNNVKEEVPHFIAINCDGIDFDDDIPSVKVEPMVVDDVVKVESLPIAEKEAGSASNVHDSHDNGSSDYFDSGNFINCKDDSDSDWDDDDSIPIRKEVFGLATECNANVDNESASISKATKNIRKNRKKKSGSSKAKAKSANKTVEKGSTKSVISEKDFQLASKYMRMNCELCDHPFETLASARAHCRSKHNSTAKFICCDRRMRIYNINDHLQYHMNPDVFKCNLCEKRLVLRAELKAHLQSHLPKQFECDICKKMFGNRYMIRSHILNCHACEKERYECQICQKRFNLQTRLDIHVKLVHKRQEQQVCHICAKVYMTAVGMKRHLEGHTDVDAPTVNCEKCGDSFKHLRNLKRHMKKHNEAGKIFQCPHCAKLSPSRAALSVHIASVHSKPMLECHLCDKKFKRTLALTEHVATHTGQDLYDCNYCPQKFKYHSSLYLHYRGVHPIEWNADRKTKPRRQVKATVETGGHPQFYSQQ